MKTELVILLQDMCEVFRISFSDYLKKLDELDPMYKYSPHREAPVFLDVFLHFRELSLQEYRYIHNKIKDMKNESR